jgi:hypothetical protein
MNTFKSILVMLALVASTHSVFAADAAIKADRSAVDAACTAEAQTAGCGADQVGTGLLKCIHAYKKANKKAFKISDGCKTAMKTLHADKKAGK